jgi:hypothetical protein
MYDVCKKELGVCCWGLVDKISPAFELPAVASRQFIPAASLNTHFDGKQLSPRLRWSSRSPRATGILRLQTLSPGSPLPIIAAYTYLKQPWQPLQIFNQKF